MTDLGLDIDMNMLNAKYKMCFSIVMAVCTKQHLSNT